MFNLLQMRIICNK